MQPVIKEARPKTELLFAKVKKKDSNSSLETDIKKGIYDSIRYDNINIQKIIISSAQPRIVFDDKSIIKLAASIEKFGLLEPIVVLENDTDGYTLLAGERRMRSFMYLKKETIDAVIFKKKDGISKNVLGVVSLIENIHRNELTPLELAIAYKEIQTMDGKNRTYLEVANIIGKSEAHVKSIMPINKLSKKIITALKKNIDFNIDSKTLSLLASVKENKEQERLFEIIFSKKLNRKEALKLIRTFKRKKYKNVKDQPNKEKVFFDYRSSKTEINVKINLKKVPSKYKKEFEEIRSSLEALKYKVLQDNS